MSKRLRIVLTRSGEESGDDRAQRWYSVQMIDAFYAERLSVELYNDDLSKTVVEIDD